MVYFDQYSSKRADTGNVAWNSGVLRAEAVFASDRKCLVAVVYGSNGWSERRRGLPLSLEKRLNHY